MVGHALFLYAHADAEEICYYMPHRRRTSREDKSSLLDCTQASKGNMPAEADGRPTRE
ncbi:MAG: hypothetical protein HFJ08_10685 [Lachnospiraceae bacterium]|nr:hypothetical protein [Lachnospiraceae bacterium]MCI9400471.1 hypothetical protein [Lachnospiraceae bacterium]